jgi:hypothetical protein
VTTGPQVFAQEDTAQHAADGANGAETAPDVDELGDLALLQKCEGDFSALRATPYSWVGTEPNRRTGTTAAGPPIVDGTDALGGSRPKQRPVTTERAKYEGSGRFGPLRDGELERARRWGLSLLRQ